MKSKNNPHSDVQLSRIAKFPVIVKFGFCLAAFMICAVSVSAEAIAYQQRGFPVADSGRWMGSAAAILTDVNGDGFDDVLTSARGYPWPNGTNDWGSGLVYVLSGADLTTIRIHEGGNFFYPTTGDDEGEELGRSVASLGDINGDSICDYAAGAPKYITGEPTPQVRGRVLVYSGVDGSVLDTLSGPSGGANFGYDLWGSHDFNNDGNNDIAVGQGESSVHIFTGDGTGQFTILQSYTDAVFMHPIGDIAGDGGSDWIVRSPIGRWYAFSHSSLTVPYDSLPGGLSSGAIEVVHIGDGGGVGDRLIVGCWQCSSKGMLYSLERSGGSWAKEDSIGALEAGLYNLDYLGGQVEIIGELNGDNWPEFAVHSDNEFAYSSWADGGLSVFRYNPAASPKLVRMDTYNDIGSNHNLSHIGVGGDFNNDGYPDYFGNNGWLLKQFLGGPDADGDDTLDWYDTDVFGSLDSDGDGWNDLIDNCPSVASQNILDTDGDGVGDPCDACPGADDVIDADGDTVPDGCDICPGFNDLADFDLDSVPDSCDNCPDTANPGQEDANMNGIGDVCDGCCQVRGNVDGDPGMGINIADVTYLVSYAFKGGPVPPCEEEGDVNGTPAIDIADVTFLVSYAFKGGPAPPPCN